jgi:DNA-binding IclR family transcriptional regulator
VFGQLGLADDAAAVYAALLAEPSLTLADLVTHTRLPERTVRKILDQLADLHLVEQSATGTRCTSRPSKTT